MHADAARQCAETDAFFAIMRMPGFIMIMVMVMIFIMVAGERIDVVEVRYLVHQRALLADAEHQRQHNR